MPNDLPDVVDPDHLRELVASRPWWHRIDLGHGIVTPGLDDSARKLEWLQLPDSFEGKSVLDVGAYDGFFSFEAERRGARRVVASDWFAWKLSGMGRALGRLGLNAFRQTKMVMMDPSPALQDWWYPYGADFFAAREKL